MAELLTYVAAWLGANPVPIAATVFMLAAQALMLWTFDRRSVKRARELTATSTANAAASQVYMNASRSHANRSEGARDAAEVKLRANTMILKELNGEDTDPSFEPPDMTQPCAVIPLHRRGK